MSPSHVLLPLHFGSALGRSTPGAATPAHFGGQQQAGMGARHGEHHLQQELSAGNKGGVVHPAPKALEEICLFRTELGRLFHQGSEMAMTTSKY